LHRDHVRNSYLEEFGVKELPLSVKEQLLELAERLPERARSTFIRATAEGLADLAIQCRSTLVYTLAGLALGELIDNLLTTNIPLTETVISLTGDHASTLGAIIGATLGAKGDLDRAAVRAETNRIIGEEIRRAMGTE
jgi:hypothetical protein